MGNKLKPNGNILDSLDEIRAEDIILTPRDEYFLGTINMTDESLEDFPLKEILKKAKGNYHEITEINLSENEFITLPKEIYLFPNLVRLELNGKNKNKIQQLENLISEIPQGIDCLKNLKELQLYANEIEKLPTSFSKLISLEVLDLSANSFTIFPNIFDLVNLKVLSLQDNEISVIPKEIQKLTNLKTIELNENEIQIIPKEFFELKNLKKIDLSKNIIEVIPDEISKLVKLEELDLPNNQIKVLPASFGQLKKLVDCDISENLIRELPCEFANLKSLKYLKLDSTSETLITPPSFIVKKGEFSIISYLEQIQTFKAQEYSRLPLLILGDGGVGKTVRISILIHSVSFGNTQAWFRRSERYRSDKWCQYQRFDH
jgi:Leucine-rich repeat (LRR) protein